MMPALNLSVAFIYLALGGAWAWKQRDSLDWRSHAALGGGLLLSLLSLILGWRQHMSGIGLTVGGTALCAAASPWLYLTLRNRWHSLWEERDDEVGLDDVMGKVNIALECGEKGLAIDLLEEGVTDLESHDDPSAPRTLSRQATLLVRLADIAESDRRFADCAGALERAIHRERRPSSRAQLELRLAVVYAERLREPARARELLLRLTTMHAGTPIAGEARRRLQRVEAPAA